MDLVSLLVIAASLAALGAYFTITLARRIPLEVLDLAQRHGRFAHLAPLDQGTGPTRAVRAGRRPVASRHGNGLHPA